jgi:Uma2 family endonuclease
MGCSVRSRAGAISALVSEFCSEFRLLSDSLDVLKNKLEEYLREGAELGWLIDPFARRVYIYRPNAAVEILENPESASGEPTLPGFVLALKEIR